MRSILSAFITIALTALVSAPASATITIVLKNSFIDTYANRATIQAPVHVFATAPRPHPNKTDGDDHAAGTSSTTGLATVIEIMNANRPAEHAGVADLEAAESKTISAMGYWRIWPEHGGSNDFVQGGAVDPITNTNPPHVFEIHPMLSIDSIDLSSSLVPISGYQPKDAETAFEAYDGTRCSISGGADTTTITTSMIGYNYVRYQLRMTPKSNLQATTDGGYEFFAQVEDPDSGDLVANKVRMVVAPGTALRTKIESMHSGQSLVVWGIPRLDLSLVRYRAAHPNARDWTLPYEMILVAAS